MAGLNSVQVDLLIGVRIGGMEVDLVLAGDQRKRLVHIGAQLVRRACRTGIITRGLDAAGEFAVAEEKALHVVALPAVHGDFDVRETAQGLLGVDAEGGVSFFRCVIAFHVCFLLSLIVRPRSPVRACLPLGQEASCGMEALSLLNLLFLLNSLFPALRLNQADRERAAHSGAGFGSIGKNAVCDHLGEKISHRRSLGGTG